METILISCRRLCKSYIKVSNEIWFENRAHSEHGHAFSMNIHIIFGRHYKRRRHIISN